MAFNFLETAVKKCNVIKNGEKVCKHIDVNGVNVWNAEYVFFPNEYTTVKSNWTSSGGSWDITSEYIYTASKYTGSSLSLPEYTVDFSKYKDLYIEISKVNNDNNYNIRWRRKNGNSIAARIEVDELPENERVGVHHINIEDINDVCYLAIDGDNGGGGYITRIWFEE